MTELQRKKRWEKCISYPSNFEWF